MRAKLIQNKYVLDADDVIVAVGEGWDQFALANGGERATAEHVLGRDLWTFVSGRETQAYLNAILFACRMDNRGFRISYRCDAPEEMRLFRLTVRPVERGKLVMEHEIIRTRESAASAEVVRLADRYDAARCSICCAFKVGEEWIDAYARPDRNYFAESFGVCPACRRKLATQLAADAPEERIVPLRDRR